jgi:hypothetical protein
MKSQLLRFQADLARERFRDFCAKEGFDKNALWRSAHHRVYEEDVLGESPARKPSSTDTPRYKAFTLAESAVRLQYQVAALEPDALHRAGWWYVPSQQQEVAKRRAEHRRRKASGVSDEEEFSNLIASLLSPKNEREISPVDVLEKDANTA